MTRENATISSILPGKAASRFEVISGSADAFGVGSVPEYRFDGFFFGYFYFYASSSAGGTGR